jgi:hypothetical protein
MGRYRCLILFVLAVALTADGTDPFRSSSAERVASGQATDYTEWIGRSLKEMETIKAGSTRAELLKVFGEEGGLSTALSRTYVYRDCFMIKVDVEFAAIGRPARDAAGRVTSVESPGDVIIKISRPYIARPILD